MEKKVSKHSSLSATVAVGMPSGVKLKIRYYSAFITIYKIQLIYQLLFRLTRANQIYSFPIHLCEEVMPSPVFYATILPLAVYVVVKKGFVEPFLREQLLKRLQKKKQENYTKLVEKKKEAEAAQELMLATYERIKNEEERKNGLVIVKALYGKAKIGRL